LGDGAPNGYPKRYQRLEARLLAAGARIRLRLAGDLHHYAHDQLQLPDGSDSHLVVAGHGGAFSHATHTVETRRPKHIRQVLGEGDSELARHLEVGLARNAEEAALPAFAPGLRYPRPLRTRRAAWTAWTGLFRFRSSGWGAALARASARVVGEQPRAAALARGPDRRADLVRLRHPPAAPDHPGPQPDGRVAGGGRAGRLHGPPSGSRWRPGAAWAWAWGMARRSWPPPSH
jgi:hypothetical protein